MEQMCESMDKNRTLGVSAGRAGNLPRSPYPSRVRSVDSATVHRRRLSLPQEICSVSIRRLRLSKGSLTAAQKSAEGVLGHDVGKASEALEQPTRLQIWKGESPFSVNYLYRTDSISGACGGNEARYARM
jgi:hypothetical protein